VLDALVQSKIDLGLSSKASGGTLRRLRDKLLGHKLRARFEFSMMSAQGGHILPHTDSPQKLITLVVSMVRPGEWDQTWGGGTDLMRPRDPSENFNLVNRYLTFDQVETIDTMTYEPNQCVIFVKTFNSLHAVKPMTGPKNIMRKTLTVNIESI
jgi:2OG-Fe(II) oxygenase superfamily